MAQTTKGRGGGGSTSDVWCENASQQSHTCAAEPHLNELDWGGGERRGEELDSFPAYNTLYVRVHCVLLRAVCSLYIIMCCRCVGFLFFFPQAIFSQRILFLFLLKEGGGGRDRIPVRLRTKKKKRKKVRMCYALPTLLTATLSRLGETVYSAVQLPCVHA